MREEIYNPPNVNEALREKQDEVEALRNVIKIKDVTIEQLQKRLNTAAVKRDFNSEWERESGDGIK